MSDSNARDPGGPSPGDPLREILRASVEQVDGALASVVMGVDGIAVEEFSRQGAGLDVQTLGTEYSSALAEVQRTSDSLQRGKVEEVSITTDGGVVLMRPVSAEYFVVLVISAGGNLGKGRYVLKRAARALAEEM